MLLSVNTVSLDLDCLYSAVTLESRVTAEYKQLRCCRLLSEFNFILTVLVIRNCLHIRDMKLKLIQSKFLLRHKAILPEFGGILVDALP
jgi:hypothetical protein